MDLQEKGFYACRAVKILLQSPSVLIFPEEKKMRPPQVLLCFGNFGSGYVTLVGTSKYSTPVASTKADGGASEVRMGRKADGYLQLAR